MNMVSETLYRCENISYFYTLHGQKNAALRNVNLSISKADFVCFQGPSGSGKSTLLNLLGLIENVQEGEIFLNATALKNTTESEKNKIRKYQIGFIFQSFNLLEALNAEENIRFFLERQNLAESEVYNRTEKYLNAVGLWDHRSKKPSEMSGGQKQRVSIARALAKHPQVIIADEPTASLDQKTGREIMTILSELTKTEGVTVVLSSHDPMAISFAKTVHHIRDGQLENG